MVGPGCAFDRVDVTGNTALAAWLLRIRKRLELSRASEADGEARRLFYRLLNDGKGE